MELDHEFTVPVSASEAWPVLLDVERIAPCMPGATLDSVDGDEFTGRLKVKLGAMTITYKGNARIAARDEQAHTVTIEGSGKEARGSGTASATVQAQLHDEGEQTRVTVHTKLNVTGRPAQFGRNILAEVGGKLIGRFADNLADEITREEKPAEAAAKAAPAGQAAEATPTPAAPAAAAPAEAPTAQAAPAEAPSARATPAAEKPAAEPTAEAPAEPAAKAAPSGEPHAAEAGQAAEAAPGDKPQAAEAAPSGGPRAAEPQAAESQAAPAKAETPAARRTAERRPKDEAIDLLEFAGPSIAKRVAPVLAGLAALWALRRIFRRARRK